MQRPRSKEASTSTTGATRPISPTATTRWCCRATRATGRTAISLRAPRRAPAGRLPTNGDGIAQDNEIGPSNNNRFGLAPARHPDADIKRPYDIEYTLGVTRQVLEGVSVTGAWYRRDTYDIETQTNTLVSLADYASFQVPNPLDATDDRHDLQPEQGQAGTDRSGRYDRHRSLDVARRTTTDSKWHSRHGCRGARRCSADGAPTRVVTVACAGRRSELLPVLRSEPVRHAVPVRLQVRGQPAAAVRRADSARTSRATPGGPLAANWAVPANLFPGGRTQSVTVNLSAPGQQVPGVAGVSSI